MKTEYAIEAGVADSAWKGGSTIGWRRFVLAEIDTDDGSHFAWSSIEEIWLIPPVANCINRRGTESGIAAEDIDVLDLTGAGDVDLQDDDGLGAGGCWNAGLGRHRRGDEMPVHDGRWDEVWSGPETIG